MTEFFFKGGASRPAQAGAGQVVWAFKIGEAQVSETTLKLKKGALNGAHNLISQGLPAYLGHFGPRLYAALQRTHPRYAMGFEKQRRTGAGSFVWSTAAQDDFPVAWNLAPVGSELFD